MRAFLRAGCLVPFLVAPAVANKIAVTTDTLPNQATDAQKHQIVLNDAGDTDLVFDEAGDFIITYNAECMAQGPDGSYLSITIKVDNQPTEPASGDDFAFCSPSQPTGQTFTAVVRKSFIKLNQTKPHHVRVYATGVGTTLWRLDDSILTVEQ